MPVEDWYAATAHTGFVGDGVPRDRQNAAPVTHNNMFSLAHNTEARSLERPNRALVWDTGEAMGYR